MKWRAYKPTPLPPSSEPLVPGLTVDEWRILEREEEKRFARGETKEITREEFTSIVQSEVMMGIPLHDSVDDWLRSHLFTMGGRPR